MSVRMLLPVFTHCGTPKAPAMGDQVPTNPSIKTQLELNYLLPKQKRAPGVEFQVKRQVHLCFPAVR